MILATKKRLIRRAISRIIIFVLLLCSCIFFSIGPAKADLNFGSAYSEIGTFNGWTFWVGWDASFSETYLPDSETYAWVVYFAPEGIFVALQEAKSTYSAVDVFAGIDFFYGALFSPDGNKLKKSYMNSLLGVGISLNNFSFSAPGGAPWSGLSAALKSGQNFFRVGSSSTPERGIQYTVGFSISYELVPIPLPISVSLDYESNMTAGFYPIVGWNIDPASEENPVDLIIAALVNLAGSGGSSFTAIAGQHVANLLLPFMRTLPSSAYFKDFLESQTHDTPIDDLIQEVEEWLQSGDTNNLPEKIRPPLDPQELQVLMRPVYGATGMAFEMGYYHGCANNPGCTTLYADCVTNVNCTPGEICSLEVTATEIAALVSGSSVEDFEGIQVIFDKPFDQYSLGQEYEYVTLQDGKAVYEFVLSADNPLMIGVRISATTATGGRALELCRRVVVYDVPNIPPIDYAGPDQNVKSRDTVTLKGYYITDPEDPSVTYQWTQTDGTQVNLSQASEAEATFTAPDVGPAGESLTFELTVTDSGGLQDTDTCIVFVSPFISSWYLISLSKQPTDAGITDVLSSVSGKYVSVWAYIDGSWKVYDPNNPGFSDLTTMEAGRGYWINMTEYAALSVTGSTPSKSIDLQIGWNLVGYNSSTSQSVADALASIYGKYVSVWAYMNGNWKVYDPNNPGFSDLTTMEPGYGYWINTTEACTWTLP